MWKVFRRGARFRACFHRHLAVQSAQTQRRSLVRCILNVPFYVFGQHKSVDAVSNNFKLWRNSLFGSDEFGPNICWMGRHHKAVCIPFHWHSKQLQLQCGASLADFCDSMVEVSHVLCHTYSTTRFTCANARAFHIWIFPSTNPCRPSDQFKFV